MQTSFRFKCATCGEIHEGMPSFGVGAPLSYYAIPERERANRCDLRDDDCVIDDKWYFVRGCIEIPVRGEQDPLSWDVWVSLSEDSYRIWNHCFTSASRSHLGPLFGWLNATLKCYPDTANLKTMVHLRDNGIRPFIELEPTNHRLSIEQREGITPARVAELFSIMVHSDDT